MKEAIKEMIRAAALAAHGEGLLPSADLPAVELEVPKLDAHGDFSTNICMQMARVQKMAPRRIAEILTGRLDDPDGLIERTEVAGPGFVNFFIRPAAWLPVLREVHRRNERYGKVDVGRGRRVQVEFVSANPTGPLHVGHGRGAAVGDTVANILAFCGFDVQREYYINDSGRQIRTLGLSVYLRYCELQGRTVEFPADCYQGAYIRDLAAALAEEKGARLLEEDEAAAVEFCARRAAADIIAGIRSDLEQFGVRFDRWFSEQSLYDEKRVDRVLADCRRRGIVYDREGAQWFRTSDYGDEKDRVVVRSNGRTTYFASDIAYHQDKFARGFAEVIDVWGADHHGYIARMKAAVAACGQSPDDFTVLLVHLVNLLRDGRPVAMSTRAGEFVTLADVVREVGRDAARFIFLTRHYESPLDFDLELAKKKSNDNPVYYVQYVHARISSIVRKGGERGVADVEPDPADLALLTAAEEIQLIQAMGRYPEVLTSAAGLREPHRVTFYLMNLAAAFHAYYNRHRVLTDDARTTAARLYLVRAVRKVIRNGLTLLGVSAPERM